MIVHSTIPTVREPVATHVGRCFRCGQRVACIEQDRRIVDSWHVTIRPGDRPHAPINVTWQVAS